MTQAPSFQKIFNKIVDDKLAALHVALIGNVTRFDSAKQTVDVKSAVGKNKQLPKLIDIPIVFPRCGEFIFAFPLKPGDTVQLLFNDVPIDAWLHDDAGSHFAEEHHSWHGVVAIPGIYPDAKAMQDLPKDALAMGHKGTSQIQIKSDQISLGKDPGDSVALAQKVLNELKKITQYLNTHTHGTSYGPTTPPTAPAQTPQSVASSLVKCA